MESDATFIIAVNTPRGTPEFVSAPPGFYWHEDGIQRESHQYRIPSCQFTNRRIHAHRFETREQAEDAAATCTQSQIVAVYE